MTNSGPRLSLIIPTFNEAGRVGATIEKASAYLARQAYESEIIVVDDGSTDGTAETVARGFEGVRIVAYGANRGKGYAMREGAKAARGEVCLVYDADASTPIEEVDRLWPEFDRGASVVIASRALPASRVEVPQPGYRRVMGRVYNLLVRGLGLTTFRDTQCGFKSFDRRIRESVVPRLVINGFGADCELLVAAGQAGLRIAEIPVRWINSSDTRVRPVRHTAAMILEVLRVRVRVWLGRYRPAALG
jgi:dolichyl-phosphate beta-glucosyltransferase